jgi:hypothetical protein
LAPNAGLLKLTKKESHQNNLYLLLKILKDMIADRRMLAQVVRNYPSIRRAVRFSRTYKIVTKKTETATPRSMNPLWEYFQNHKEGQGIWKWEHYFDIYHRHFSKFVGQKVNVLEIGIYSGGSLEMWRSYFGERSHIYGIDIQEACKKYENDHISVFIGDQEDRSFWNNFRKGIEGIDILIDDGGHTPEQQQITLEEMLPHIRPGGVYLCEDVHNDPSRFNEFTTFATTLIHELNAVNNLYLNPVLRSNVSQFQSSVHSIHFYPFVVVIEKHCVPPTKLLAPKHGTMWQPFT